MASIKKLAQKNETIECNISQLVIIKRYIKNLVPFKVGLKDLENTCTQGFLENDLYKVRK